MRKTAYLTVFFMTASICCAFDAAAFAEKKAAEISLLTGAKAAVEIISCEPSKGKKTGAERIEPTSVFFEDGYKITAKVSAYKKALRPLRTILKGEKFRPQDFETADVDVIAMNYEPVPAEESLEGAVSTRIIQKGKPVSVNDFSMPFYVRPGTEAEIIFEEGLIRISAQARAEEPGFIGDVIKVRNTKSKTILFARVTEGPKFICGGAR